jgi:hypothetical protein
LKITPTQREGPVIRGVKVQGQVYLPQVAFALGIFAFIFGSAQNRQQEGSHNRNDRDHDQQLDQSKTAFSSIYFSRNHKSPFSLAPPLATRRAH